MRKLIDSPFDTALYLRLAIAFVLAWGLSGCAMTLVDWVTPNSGYSATTDIAYGELPRQQYDVYIPTEPLANAPTLVFIYGGSWQEGDKDSYRFVAQAFASAGYAVVIPDYRVYPAVKFPTFIEDCASAVANYLDHNPDKEIVLVGHSAGAHIAAMLALNPEYLQAVSIDRNKISAWVGWSGPYDFLPITSPTLQTIFNGADDIPETQPIHFANPKSPPALLIHGEDDETVYPKNTRNLAAALRQYHVPVEELYYPDTGHIFTVGALISPFRSFAPTLEDTLTFLKKL